jgi:hypothetical protein
VKGETGSDAGPRVRPALMSPQEAAMTASEQQLAAAARRADLWYAWMILCQNYGAGHLLSIQAHDQYRASGGTGN